MAGNGDGDSHDEFEDFASDHDEFEDFSDDESSNVLELLSDIATTRTSTARVGAEQRTAVAPVDAKDGQDAGLTPQVPPVDTASTQTEHRAWEGRHSVLDFEDLFDDVFRPSSAHSATEGTARAVVQIMESDKQESRSTEQHSSQTAIESHARGSQSEHTDAAVIGRGGCMSPQQVDSDTIRGLEKVFHAVQRDNLAVQQLVDACHLDAFCVTMNIAAADPSWRESFENFAHWAQKMTEHMNTATKQLARDEVERSELLLVILDLPFGVARGEWTDKWAKTVDAILLFTQLSKQTATNSPGTQEKATAPDTNQQEEASELMWGKFSPKHMPARRPEPPLIDSRTKLHPVMVSTRTKRFTRLRVQCDAEKELTFRPKINHRKGIRRHRVRFLRRMERDLAQRQARASQCQDEKKRQEEEEQKKLQSVSLVDLGSQRILKRSGLWYETFESRIRRLETRSKLSASRRSSDGSPGTRQRRGRILDPRRYQAVCESLYRDSLDKRQRDKARDAENLRQIRADAVRTKMTPRSLSVVQDRLREEIDMICCRVNGKDAPTRDQQTLSYIEFSCALLYFGLVPELNTRWADNSNVTLLWHAWTLLSDQPCQNNKDSEEDNAVTSNGVAKQKLIQLLHDVIIANKVDSPRGRYDDDQQHLIAVCQLHYLSRKRCKIVGLRDTKDKTIQSLCKMSSASSAQHKYKRTVQYSMHGRRMTKAGSDPLEHRSTLVRAKLERMRRLQEQEEVVECTFQPAINRSASWQCNSPTKLGIQSPQRQQPAYERLYHEAQQRHNVILTRYFEAKMQDEEHDKKEMAVRPTIVNGLAVDERLDALRRALANSALPVNFDKTVESMRCAYEAKAVEAQARANRLEPPKFERGADGRTIVVPFNLATDQRFQSRANNMRNLDNNKTTSMRPARRSISHKLAQWQTKVRQRLAQQPSQNQNPTQSETQGYDKPSSRPECNSASADADIRLDVHLTPYEMRPLFLHLNKDPLAQATAFATTHALSESQHRQLLSLVARKLKELVHFEF